MSENPPEAPRPGPATDPTPDPKPDAAPAENKGSGRFAVYNETLRQYVGGVVDKRPTKAEANKAVPEGHKAIVREV